jgi:hypothetical protein
MLWEKIVDTPCEAWSTRRRARCPTRFSRRAAASPGPRTRPG